MEDFIIIAVLVLIVGLAAWYVIRAKKRGVKCIGCSACSSENKEGACTGHCSSCCGCGQTPVPQNHTEETSE